MSAPLTDQQLAVIEATIRGFIPGAKDSATVSVSVIESDDVNGLRNSWTGPLSFVVGQIEDRLLIDSASGSDAAEVGYLLTELKQLRADLAHRDAAFDAVLAMDDDVNTLFSLGQVARTYTRALAAPADPCRAEPVHQAGCPAA